LSIRRDVLEDTVLGALRERLMDPDLFQVFVEAFAAQRWFDGQRSCFSA
jgi:site-specific DNA recombinase